MSQNDSKLQICLVTFGELMKSLVCIIVLFCCQSIYYLSAKVDSTSLEILQITDKARLIEIVDSLIISDLEENQDKLILLSKKLTFEEKNLLYNSNKVNPVLQILFNLTFGFGIGSLIDGKYLLGTSCLLMEASSIAILISSPSINVPKSGHRPKYNYKNLILDIAVSLYALSRMVGIYVPIVDACNTNPILKKALQYDQNSKVENVTKISLEPYFCISEFFNYRIGMQLVLRL